MKIYNERDLYNTAEILANRYEFDLEAVIAYLRYIDVHINAIGPQRATVNMVNLFCYGVIDVDQENLNQYTPFDVQYGAADAMKKGVRTKVIAMILKKYGRIAIEEIKVAFDMWASGKYEQFNDIQMYRGAMNVTLFGKILRAYTKNRRKISGTYKSYITNRFTTQQAREKKDAARTQFEEQFPKAIMAARAAKIHWKKVPVYWKDAILKRFVLDFDKAFIEQVWSDARQLATDAIESNKEAKGPRRMFEGLEASDFESLAIRYARQLFVYRLCIISKDWKPVKLPNDG